LAYDQEVAHRIRALLAAESGVEEKKMFGGLAFLVRGNMAIAASGQGGVLVRVDPAGSERLVASSPAEVAVMQGRPMPGWLRLTSEDVATKRQLEKWTKLALGYAHTLPDKSAPKR
jgi:TfoX/Sxy family transcriptional regulator of competence genes